MYIYALWVLTTGEQAARLAIRHSKYSIVAPPAPRWHELNRWPEFRARRCFYRRAESWATKSTLSLIFSKSWQVHADLTLKCHSNVHAVPRYLISWRIPRELWAVNWISVTYSYTTQVQLVIVRVWNVASRFNSGVQGSAGWITPS